MSQEKTYRSSGCKAYRLGIMKEGLIDCVIVGADRIALNGDTANKIGTYSLAVLAKENNIPFPIEERSPAEITHIKGIRIAPEGVKVRNPAFDVTPNKYISAIITEKGIIYPPYDENIKKYRKASNSMSKFEALFFFIILFILFLPACFPRFLYMLF